MNLFASKSLKLIKTALRTIANYGFSLNQSYLKHCITASTGTEPNFKGIQEWSNNYLRLHCLIRTEIKSYIYSVTYQNNLFVVLLQFQYVIHYLRLLGAQRLLRQHYHPRRLHIWSKYKHKIIYICIFVKIFLKNIDKSSIKNVQGRSSYGDVKRIIKQR